LDLLLPADHRIELALASRLGEVAPELVKNQGGGRGRLRGSTRGGGLLALIAMQELDHLLAHPVQVRAELDQDLGGHALTLADEAEQDVPGADVMVTKLPRFAQGELERRLGARRERDVSRRCLLALADDLLDLLPHRFQADSQGLQGLRGDALTLVDKAEQ